MAVSTLRESLSRGEAVLAPGAWDAITARLFRHMGFGALYVPFSQTGVVLGSAASVLTVTQLAMVTERVSEGVQDGMPVIVDAGPAFGGPEQAANAVEVLEDAGASAIQIDDRAFPLTSPGDDESVSIEAFRDRIAAAVRARRSNDLLIIASTHALGARGRDDAIARAGAALEAGANVVAVEGLTDAESYRWLRGQIPSVPLLASAGHGGLPVDELKALGYQLIAFPDLSIQTSLGGVYDTWNSVADTGRLLPQRPESMQIINKLLELEEKFAVESATTEANSVVPHRG